MHPVSQRIKLLVDHFSEGKVTDFGDKIGHDYQKISRLFKPDDRSGRFPKPSSEILSSIINTFTDVNADWLYRLKGEMLKDTPVYSTDTDDLKENLSDKTDCMECQKLNKELLEAYRKLSVLQDEKDHCKRELDKIYLENPQIVRPVQNGKSRAG